MNNLGFGAMRLPLNSSDPKDIDLPQVNAMVDEFLDAGLTYFDTSYVYHEGRSQPALRSSLVDRYPRDSFVLATKFPIFNRVPEDKMEEVFQSQLDALGVDYIDYYLLHNVQALHYDGIDGSGGIIKQTHLFDHLAQWKKEGRARHIGFSFHSSAAVLDRILRDHPEVEFVQIALNPIDWDSEFVQAAKCLEVIRRHGKQAVLMEIAKGGALSKLPKAAEAVLQAINPESSPTSWMLRFSLSIENAIAVLSGMSTLEQMRENIITTKGYAPLDSVEQNALWTAMHLYRESAPINPNMLKAYEGLVWNGVPATAILQAYSICQIQPDPCFSDDHNYFKNALAELAHLDMRGEIPRPKIALTDGTDGTELIDEAVDWLITHSY